MLFSNLIAFFIIVTTAATLHANGIVQIETASQAAEALRPVAGQLTFVLFAAGIIGTGLLAVPVLAGSAAYAVAEMLGLQGPPVEQLGSTASLARRRLAVWHSLSRVSIQLPCCFGVPSLMVSSRSPS
jgi:Mn2+/Fe2+ NRAMP family transporter